jgi:hypothetical protein
MTRRVRIAECDRRLELMARDAVSKMQKRWHPTDRPGPSGEPAFADARPDPDASVGPEYLSDHDIARMWLSRRGGLVRTAERDAIVRSPLMVQLRTVPRTRLEIALQQITLKKKPKEKLEDWLKRAVR